MDVRTKLEILADAAKYDASCASSGSKRAAAPGGIGNAEGMGICHSYTPDGRCVSLLKILLTNFCIFDCQYCVNRISSDTRRARFTPEEVVQLTLDFYKRNYIEGLFLSSGVLKSPDHTMEQMIEVARTLRQTHRFGGYIHLKAVAGASRALVEEAGLWADRLSANVELPTEGDLQKLAPEKSLGVIRATMGQMRDRITQAKAEQQDSPKAAKFAPAGQSTQMIVGATPSTDASILFTADSLYRDYKLVRVYYSAYSPIPHSDPRLPAKSPPLVREHRLYQADWLMRFYGFMPDEIPTGETGMLALDIDPKLAWALAHREQFPVDVNRAGKEMLLRVPGLGIKAVKRIISSRRVRKLHVDDLARLRVPLKHVLPFVTVPGHKGGGLLDSMGLESRLKPAAEQLQLFPPLVPT